MANKTSIINRIHQLSPQSQRQWGTMSIEQMMVHCSDQIRVCLGTKAFKNRSSWFTRNVAKWIGMNLPLDLPKNMRTFKEINPTMGVMTATSTFEADKNLLLTEIQNMELKADDFKFVHPMLGKLSKSEVTKLTYKHLDHHLKQFGV